jgi:hypothetical protein
MKDPSQSKIDGVNNNILYIQPDFLLEYDASTTTGTTTGTTQGLTTQGLTPQAPIVPGQLSESSASFHATACTCRCSPIIII